MHYPDTRIPASSRIPGTTSAAVAALLSVGFVGAIIGGLFGLVAYLIRIGFLQ